MEIAGFGTSDIGRRRERNEDSYLINTGLNLFVVADGMGGHLGGECASKLAVSTVEELVIGLFNDPDTTLQSNSDVRPGDHKSYLKYAISVAGNRIFERATVDPSLHGMGTTIVAVLFIDDKAYVANVGDSRCYLIRRGKLKQLTDDHSLVGEQLRAGVLSPVEAMHHRLKNVITRSVGFQNEVDVDVSFVKIRIGDKFLLCTDGLTNMVRNEDMCETISEKSVRDACNSLVELANERGGDDNITVVIAEVTSLGKEEMIDEETKEL